MSTHSLNREELYEQVWSEPVTKVALRYGVSHVAIAKVCRKLSIPVLAIPKSSSLGSPSLLTRIFRGLISRCTTRFL